MAMLRATSVFSICISLLLATSCTTTPHQPAASVHYLGHAAFLLRFANGVTVLTDYGQSMAYGLDSPVYGFGDVLPHVVTFSHDHADHAGGELPDGISHVLTNGENLTIDGLTITSIGTFEQSLDESDNVSYLFEYDGLKILHLGDCQALITGVDDPGIRDRVHALYPDTYDLVLVPIGSVEDIVSAAVAFTSLLNARRIVPMHYWSLGDRDRYLNLIRDRSDLAGRPYEVRNRADADLSLDVNIEPFVFVEVVGLSPAAARGHRK